MLWSPVTLSLIFWRKIPTHYPATEPLRSRRFSTANRRADHGDFEFGGESAEKVGYKWFLTPARSPVSHFVVSVSVCLSVCSNLNYGHEWVMNVSVVSRQWCWMMLNDAEWLLLLIKQEPHGLPCQPLANTIILIGTLRNSYRNLLKSFRSWHVSQIHRHFCTS